MSHPPSTLQLIFLDRTVEECQFKHFNGQFFVLINIFLCNSAILIKTVMTPVYGVSMVIKLLTLKLIVHCKVNCYE